jgi:hypothetical protein
MEAKISKNTELGPSDIIRNRKGKLYRIDTFHGDKNTFRVSPWPAKAGEENPSYVIISRDTLIAKEWDKMDKNNIKLPSEEEKPEEVEETADAAEATDSEENSESSESSDSSDEESGTVFSKEDKSDTEDNLDF